MMKNKEKNKVREFFVCFFFFWQFTNENKRKTRKVRPVVAMYQSCCLGQQTCPSKGSTMFFATWTRVERKTHENFNQWVCKAQGSFGPWLSEVPRTFNSFNFSPSINKWIYTWVANHWRSIPIFNNHPTLVQPIFSLTT
jgi:hypothetical protein